MEDEEELRIKYLYNISQLFNTDNKAQALIKTNLLSNCIKHSSEHYRLPNILFGTRVRCQTCQAPWKDNKYLVRVEKQKKFNKKKRKRLQSIAFNKDGLRQAKEIEKAKEKLAKKYLSITCLLCNHITKDVPRNNSNKIDRNSINKTPIVTPNAKPAAKFKRKLLSAIDSPRINKSINQSIVSTPQRQTVANVTLTPSNAMSSAKKRKQKDKFAGLTKLACQSVTMNTPVKTNNPMLLLMKRK